jgi:hypothetical protein
VTSGAQSAKGPADKTAPYVSQAQPSPTAVAPASAIVAPFTTSPLALQKAPAMSGILYVPNRSSVQLFMPAIAGAKDYRVFAVRDGVSVQVASTEHVAGATIFCAGLRQRNQCDPGEVLPITYGDDTLDMPSCPDNGHSPPVAAEVLRSVEVNGLGASETLVVEAIDRQCPFPGVLGNTHQDVQFTTYEMPPDQKVDVTIGNQAYALTRWPPSMPIRTEAEITAQYGSMIFNGQGWQLPELDPTAADYPQSPWIHIAQPAPVADPVVLANAVVQVQTQGTSALPSGFAASDTFDDFADDTDQPTLVRTTGNLPTAVADLADIALYQTKNWNLYSQGVEASAFFVDRGLLHMVLADRAQDTMSTLQMNPRQAVHLPSDADKYLHVTFEVQTQESSRRYFSVALCGSDTPGASYVGDTPATAAIPRPGFMDGDGTGLDGNTDGTARTNPLGWNCLYLVPRGKGYYSVGGGDISGTHADTSLRVTVVKTHAAPTSDDDYDNNLIPTGDVQNFGPNQDSAFPLVWERQIDDAQQVSGVWLDDQQNVWQRTKFDLFIRRDRVVAYVNGEQRMCSNLAGSFGLTMAEGVLGLWHVFYHSSAEFTEAREHADWANPTTAQHHMMHNIPFIDVRAWDNVGYQENVSAPADFDANCCL